MYITCRLLRGVGGREASVGHRGVGAEHHGHGVAGGANLCTCWDCPTEPLQAGGVFRPPVQNLEETRGLYLRDMGLQQGSNIVTLSTDSHNKCSNKHF